MHLIVRFALVALLLYVSAFIGPLAVFTILAAATLLVWGIP